ncbi:MAG: hypothetical protein M1816_007753 [Peltula sp. TS41687]|nr:MAG: hypothetical protein M1816_007753 [Peltula sp. TS41687]
MASSISILIVNPNSSEVMTAMMKETISSLAIPNTHFVYFTAPPSSPASIDSEEDAARSADVCWPSLKPLVPYYDGILVACYSQHPLVAELGHFAAETASGGARRPYALGIFEASITMALNLLAPFPGCRFGIMTTGQAWEEPLSGAVRGFLAGNWDGRLEQRFAGVGSTGLSARELHDVDERVVKERIRVSTGRFLSSEAGEQNVGVVCLGCAGMTGFDEAVRLGCQDAYGEKMGSKVKVVDAVKAGVMMLLGLVRGGF